MSDRVSSRECVSVSSSLSLSDSHLFPRRLATCLQRIFADGACLSSCDGTCVCALDSARTGTAGERETRAAAADQGIMRESSLSPSCSRTGQSRVLAWTSGHGSLHLVTSCPFPLTFISLTLPGLRQRVIKETLRWSACCCRKREFGLCVQACDEEAISERLAKAAKRSSGVPRTINPRLCPLTHSTHKQHSQLCLAVALFRVPSCCHLSE